MNRRTNPLLALLFAAVLGVVTVTSLRADYFSYVGSVPDDVKRDRIMAIAEDYQTLVYYVGEANITPTCAGTICPDTTIGWKVGMKYCWGGEVTPRQFLEGIDLGLTAGNRDTSGGSHTGECAVGADCSGFVSNAWTSPRYATSGFGNISDDIAWDNLRMGDALNNAGSHIRLMDYFIDDAHTAMIYESTGFEWKMQHRSLARDNNYQPIRYHNPNGYQVYDYPEPDITLIKRTGIERVLVRWDGQADIGFNLYMSDDGNAWTLVRDAAALLPVDRYCDVSGLLPDHTYYFKMTAGNSGGDTIDSDVVAYRLDGAARNRLLLVDGYDRYRQKNNAGHTFMTMFGAAIGARGLGFDFCHNEAVVDEQIDVTDYDAVVWMLGDESTIDETFSWPEQMHLMNFLENGGCLFVSGSEIGWDIDYKVDTAASNKNGHINDATFYNEYLRADYVSDDAQTYHVLGAPGSIFAGLDFYFDDGTHGTYDAAYPDQISPYGGATTGMTYSGGLGGYACVYDKSPTLGSIVHMGFPFETIYPESARLNIIKATLTYFDLPVEPPTIKSATQTAPDALSVTWTGYASQGFRLFQKTGAGSWVLIQNEGILGPDASSAKVESLSAGIRYAFKVQAVNGGGASGDSDAIICSLGVTGHRILIVDGYDRWNAQAGGWANHTLLEHFADALSSNAVRYDSCANECVVEGDVVLASYDIVMWMSGEESTESETFGYDEQVAIQNYLKAGGMFFASGAEIGWDLSYKAGANNDFANGSANDTPFYNNYLKAGAYALVDDDADTYDVTGAAGSVFAGLAFSFDDGTHGTYDVNYPDVLTANGGSANALYYDSGPKVAGLTFEGAFPGGSSDGKLVFFGFPFETIYNAAHRATVMSAILEFFGPPTSGVDLWYLE